MKYATCILALLLTLVILFCPQSGVTNTASADVLAVDKPAASLWQQVLSAITEFFFGVQVDVSRKGERVEISCKETEAPTETPAETPSAKPPEELPTEPEPTPESGRTAKKPSVLIYHTHTDEAYFKGDQDYIETSTGRTMSFQYGVVSVGERLKECLEEQGFAVVHDKTDNDTQDFNHAYQKSYQTISPYIGKTDIFLDLHRDAYYDRGDGNFLTRDGKEYAYICFVVANGENYTYPPNYEENYALATALTKELNAIFPGICKPVIVRSARYNQQVSDCCILAEMGNERNTLEQARNSAELLAQAMAEYW